MTDARRAGTGDADALVELRAVMFEAMGRSDPTVHGWQEAARAWFAEQLARPNRFAAYVVEVEARVVSGACGMLVDHAPGPTSLGTTRGYVFNVATMPGARRLGYGRRCLESLVAWFETQPSVRFVDLTSTGDGRGLYESFGFVVSSDPAMRLWLKTQDAPADTASVHISSPLRTSKGR